MFSLYTDALMCDSALGYLSVMFYQRLRRRGVRWSA